VDPQAVAALDLDEARLEMLLCSVRERFDRVDEFMNLV
jgi:hypothetical protein